MTLSLKSYWAMSVILILTYLYDASLFGFDRLGTVVMVVFAGMTLFVYLRKAATPQTLVLELFLLLFVSLRIASWLGHFKIDGLENILATLVAMVGLLHCTCEAKYLSDH